MDINVRNSLPTSQFGSESVETWLRDVYRRIEDLEFKSLSPRITSSSPSGGSGAGVHLPFVTIGNTSQLTAERSLVEGDYINITDGGPNTSVSVALDINALDTHSNGRYLRLDTSNDPLTGELDIIVEDAHALRVTTTGPDASPFPTTPILDSFDRPDEGPPPSASWTDSAAADTGLQVISSKLNAGPETTLLGVSAWNPTQYSDCEQYVTTAPNTTSDGIEFWLIARAQVLDDPFSDCYAVNISVSGGSAACQFFVCSSGESTPPGGAEIGLPQNFPADVGDSFGWSVVGSGASIALTLYHKPQSGSWTEIYQLIDTSEYGYDTGYLAIGLWSDDSGVDSSPFLDDFGGGAYVAPRSVVFNVNTLTGMTSAERIEISQEDGLSPLVVTSQTVVDNLNADMLDGQHAGSFVPITRTIGTTAPLSGGGDLSSDRTLAISQAATSADGYLTSTDWNTFNSKQPAGSYITALTGDVTASGPGSAASTLATVNSNVGSFGSATQVATFTVNGKGLITAAGNTTIAGVTPASHDIAGALHTTSGRTAGQVLQATGAATFGWSTYALTIGAASSISGTAIVGTPGTLTVSTTNAATAPHTHAITTSTVGAASTIMATDANGYARAAWLGLGTSTAPAFQLDVRKSTTTNDKQVYFSNSISYGTGTYSQYYSRQFYDVVFIADVAADYYNNFFYSVYQGNTASSPHARIWAQVNQVDTAYGSSYAPLAIEGQWNKTIHYSSARLTSSVGARCEVSNQNVGGITSAIGAYYRIINQASIGAGTIDNAYALYVAQPVVSGGAVITNAYGLAIENQNKATGLNYAIYSSGGQSWHSGNIGIGNGATAFSAAANLHAINTSATTNAAVEVARFEARVDGAGVGGTGFGPMLTLYGESASNGGYRQMAAIKALYSTPTDASRKAQIIGTVFDTAERTWLQVDTDGASSDVLINSLIYGAFYMDDGAQAVTATAAGSYYEVGGGMTTSLVNSATFQNSKELLITVAGRYSVDWSMSFRVNNSDQIIGGAVMVNSAQVHETENVTSAKENGVVYSTSGTGVVALAANDVVKLCVENETAAGSVITVTHANLKIVRIGE